MPDRPRNDEEVVEQAVSEIEQQEELQEINEGEMVSDICWSFSSVMGVGISNPGSVVKMTLDWDAIRKHYPGKTDEEITSIIEILVDEANRGLE
jgi:hypothetical protein